jgi:hypothetical protein
LNSPYGLLRSPWNYNPDPYVTRFGNVLRIADASSLVDGPGTAMRRQRVGVVCADYTALFDAVRGQPLATYLAAVDDATHLGMRLALGGVGGDRAAAAAQTLMETYGFTDGDVAAVAASLRPLVQLSAVARGGDDGPSLTCTNPAAGSDADAPQCAFPDASFQDEAGLDTLVRAFFLADPGADAARDRVLALPFPQRADAMKLVATMAPYDGDVAGASAAMDPLLWLSLGAVERLYQTAAFAGTFSDMAYASKADVPCPGHAPDTLKPWLEGLGFAEPSVQAETLTTAELTYILDPQSDEYRDLIKYVYDGGNGLAGCPDAVDTWFVQEGAT